MSKKGDRKPKFNLVGERYGKLTVMKYNGVSIGKTGRTNHTWLCKCDCGNTKIASTKDLRSEHCKSCGCIPHIPKRITWVKHRKTGTRLYNIWKSMKGRCYTPSCAGYEHYGGRGITVCDEWKNDFNAFYKWAIENGYDESAPKGVYTIERINVDGNYEPNNCRWATFLEQGNNKRNSEKYMYNGELLTLRQISEKSGVDYGQLKSRIDRGLSIFEALYNTYEPARYYYEFNGERHSIPEWSLITGIKCITIRARLKRGWSIERTLTTPINEKGRDLWKHRKYRKGDKK